MVSTESGKWLEDSLQQLCSKVESGLQLDNDVISGLVYYCENALPEDAKEYIINILGKETGQDIVEEYMLRRSSRRNLNLDMVPKEDIQVYMKPPAEGFWSGGNKKVTKSVAVQKEMKAPTENSDVKDSANGKVNAVKKKKGSRAISIAEAAKGSVVLQPGKPCDCQARRHKLVTNCLSCGKIICEQAGEGPCSFCGALVLREGSNYAGLDNVAFQLSEAESKAEAFKNRLVEYDRNSAERTSVIDDQSDYYEYEGNTWISEEEKKLLQKKQEEIEEAKQANRNKVVVTFDLVGRKVVMTDQVAAELETQNSILRPTFVTEDRASNRIKSNPHIREQPVFIDASGAGNSRRDKKVLGSHTGLLYEISGRVQHDDPLVGTLSPGGIKLTEISVNAPWQGPKVRMQSFGELENNECSVDV
ncbi:hypothetical protein SUGI_1065250 [Cryptomeria japonica]|uniref:uncharacterized protein LOC131029958 n=1 Tax=Cryptomeria japonica TaxID=3369 RepID=UPI002414CFB0|nr:uncharacterized protein LOC131029958 [Cryptomeria japonica]GLJ50084.1 hypothetical protein SUGI_1065250 [Cryptomeria japonica]